MAYRRGAIASMALCIVVAVTSCAYQQKFSTPLAIKKDVAQPAAIPGSAGEEGKTLAAEGRDSDCVLTTGDLHLWCKWIARYY